MFVDNHLGNVFVLVLFWDVQGQFAIVGADVTIAAFEEKFFYDSAVAGHDGEVEGGHAEGELLFVDLCAPGYQSIGCILHTTVACPMQRCAPFGISDPYFESLIQKVILILA